MTNDSRSSGTVQIALRISPDLRERIKATAEANNRSVNSELTATLEEQYPKPFSADEDLTMACVSALMFGPKRGGDKFTSEYLDAIRYVRDVHGIADPVALSNGFEHHKEALENIPVTRVFEWVQKVFHPWVKRHPTPTPSSDPED